MMNRFDKTTHRLVGYYEKQRINGAYVGLGNTQTLSTLVGGRSTLITWGSRASSALKS